MVEVVIRLSTFFWPVEDDKNDLVAWTILLHLIVFHGTALAAVHDLAALIGGQLQLLPPTQQRGVQGGDPAHSLADYRGNNYFRYQDVHVDYPFLLVKVERMV
uniref:Uncharacterized protein n=1 Tax=Oryza punctata TaxID=4537 RepID=A0A0E0LHM6_ORYPU